MANSSQEFDPYLQWLGIREPTRPPNAYRLLGIELFESDRDVIETAADRQMSHLRTFQNGRRAELSQDVLNEVSAARVLLLDEQRKAAYDKQLRSDVDRQRKSSPTHDQVQQKSVELNPPGRGRAERPWYYWVALASPMLLISVAVIGYQLTRIAWHQSKAQEAIQQARRADQPQDEPSTDRDSSDDTSTQDSTDGPSAETAADDPPDDGTENQRDDESDADTQLDPPDEQAAPDDASAEDVDSTAPPHDVNDWLTATCDSSLQSWNQLPPQSDDTVAFTQDSAIGKFLSALARRNVEEAEGMLSAMKNNIALGIEPNELADAEFILSVTRQFWERAAVACEKLSIGDQLNYRSMRVTVRAIDEQTIELVSDTGESNVFSRVRTEMDLGLATALVERESMPNLPVAWRLAAVAYGLDGSGSLWHSEQLAAKSESLGLSADFLSRTLRGLQGRPVLPVPESLEPIAEQRLTQTDEPRSIRDVPDRKTQLEARRAVLSPETTRLRDAKVPRETHGAELFAKATDASLSSAEVYVLLKSSLARATTYRDVDTAWSAIERLEREYGEDGDSLRYRAIERVARRLKGEAKRPYALRARELALRAMYRDDYDDASKFASLAQVIAKPINDPGLSDYALLAKKQILAAKDSYRRLENVRDRLRKAPQDGWARSKLAEFEILTKANFDALASHRSGAPAELRELIEAELSVGRLPARQREVGEGWFRLGRSLKGVQRQSAYQRAMHWLGQALPDLPGDQQAEVRDTVAAIRAEIGRPSSLIDLTQQQPSSSKVGFGQLGVNENPNLSDERISPLPEVNGATVRRFFWACAPSVLTFEVEAGVTSFRGTGYLNAASNDGVRFIVLADGVPIYQSSIAKDAQTEVPIEATIKSGTRQIQLRVDAINNPVCDHTYWIDPVLVFPKGG